MLIREFLPQARIYWLEDVQAVRVEYLKLFADLDVWKEIWEAVLEVIHEKKTNIWIHDSYNSDGVFSNEVQEYVKNILIPKGINAGITNVLTVVPREVGLVSMTNKKWQSEAKKTGVLLTMDFLSLDDVKKWIFDNNKIESTSKLVG